MKKAGDHCYLSGKYRRTARSYCNLNLKLPSSIPVLCHNSTNYDTNLFIKDLCRKYNKVNLIANIDEKYISYTVNTGYGYEFDENDKPRKYLYQIIVCRFIQICVVINRDIGKGHKKRRL